LSLAGDTLTSIHKSYLFQDNSSCYLHGIIRNTVNVCESNDKTGHWFIEDIAYLMEYQLTMFFQAIYRSSRS